MFMFDYERNRKITLWKILISYILLLFLWFSPLEEEKTEHFREYGKVFFFLFFSDDLNENIAVYLSMFISTKGNLLELFIRFLLLIFFLPFVVLFLFFIFAFEIIGWDILIYLKVKHSVPFYADKAYRIL